MDTVLVLGEPHDEGPLKLYPLELAVHDMHDALLKNLDHTHRQRSRPEVITTASSTISASGQP